MKIMNEEAHRRFKTSSELEHKLRIAYLDVENILPVETPLEKIFFLSLEQTWKMSFKIMSRNFCIFAHGDQKRKYTGEPYFTHPATVAYIIESHGGTLEMIAAAYLHDVLEDTSITEHEILYHFGPEIKNLVVELTDVSKTTDGNRAIRKEIDRLRLKTISPEAKSIKCADIQHNLESIEEYDKDFAMQYFTEKRSCLEFLSDASIPALYSHLESKILNWFDKNV